MFENPHNPEVLAACILLSVTTFQSSSSVGYKWANRICTGLFLPNQLLNQDPIVLMRVLYPSEAFNLKTSLRLVIDTHLAYGSEPWDDSVRLLLT